MTDLSHLDALQVRLSHERARLAAATMVCEYCGATIHSGYAPYGICQACGTMQPKTTASEQAMEEPKQEKPRPLIGDIWAAGNL